MVVLKPRPLAALAVNLALALAALVTLFPLVWMVSASLMAPGEASTYPPPLLPRAATLANYRLLFAEHGLLRQAANSLLIALLATGLSLAFNLTAGYAFAKLRFPGRDRVFRLLLGALIVPAQVAMSVARAAGIPPMSTVGQPGGRIGPPTWGTTPVTIGQTCMSVTRAAGIPMRSLLSPSHRPRPRRGGRGCGGLLFHPAVPVLGDVLAHDTVLDRPVDGRAEL